MKELIIVESPTKAKHISKILNYKYDVISTRGHLLRIADVGEDNIGVDLKTWRATYEEIHPQIMEYIKEKASKASKVYLASDPDREGEVISYALLKRLNLDNENVRISYHEITKSAIIKALENPTSVDINLVSAQITRAIVDKIVGYKLSKYVNRAIGAQSAGRVQSVALRIICEREKEIEDFVPQKYYLLKAHTSDFVASYDIDEVTKIDEYYANRVIEEATNPFIISDINIEQNIKKYYIPYKTSTLLQDANRKLRLSSSTTMSLAQNLFQNGYITYHRTTDTTLASSFVYNTREYIKDVYGEEYASYPISYKENTGAHEAIRPTSIKVKGDDLNALSANEKRLYELIYNQTLASIMSPSIRSKAKITISSNGHNFSASSTILTFDGNEKILPREIETDNIKLPIEDFGGNESFNVKDEIRVSKISKKESSTIPPYRYTQASLIKKLEDENIGRPSTYSHIVTIITSRDYVEMKRNYYYPTKLGVHLNEILTQNFDSFINIGYTAKLEESLDLIALGEAKKNDILDSFYSDFSHLLELGKNIKYSPIPKEISPYPKVLEPAEDCPLCGSKLIVQYSKKNRQEFIACSNFPKCKYTRTIPGQKTYRKTNFKKKTKE